MRTGQVIYQATQDHFFDDVQNGRVYPQMCNEATLQGLETGEAEKRSWENNVPKIKELLACSGVKDTYVTFEYLLPRRNQRIDCMIYGKDAMNRDNVIHIELKQWSNETVSDTCSKGNFSVENPEVEALTGGERRIVAHPSQQVRGYHDYLTHFIEIISKEELGLTGVAYCYNYIRHTQKGTPALYQKEYDDLQKEYRTYAKDELTELAEKVHQILGGGQGFSIFNKMMTSPVRESQKLLNSVAGMLNGEIKSRFNLLDEQIAARNEIFDKVRKLKDSHEKSIIIVQGGPGTGKTVIALEVLASLAGKHYQVHYATKSASLVNAIHYQLPRGNGSKKIITGLTEFNPLRCEENAWDVLMIDEAHRIEEYYYTGFGRSKRRISNTPQIDSLLRATKILVLFIDDLQAIRSAEVGSTEMIKDCAERNHVHLETIHLYTQFRCNGSDNYLDWLDQWLYNKPVTNRFKKNEYDFRILDSPQELYDLILSKDNPNEDVTARLMAGFCWPWSDSLDEKGQPIKDVEIGNFAMPWETHRNLKTAPQGYVRWYEWAYRPEGIKQVGCIYTAQGFEFDYAGVIIGPDLTYNEETKQIETCRDRNKDPMLTKSKGSLKFDLYVRNIYRVLMSRGMKGTYVYCCDEKLRNYITEIAKECIQ